MSTIAATATPPGAGGIGIVRLSGPQAKEILARVFLPYAHHFENFRPWMLHRGRVLDHDGLPLDDVLAVFMPGPRTFTGEDMAEIHCHGSPVVLQALLETLLRLGARAAERGEFSRRAFLNGRMDLSQAEAVAELVAAPSREALGLGLNRLDGLLARKVDAMREDLERLRSHVCLAVDFPDDEVGEDLAPQAFAASVDAVAKQVSCLLSAASRARMMQQGAVVVLAGAVNAGKSSLLNALLGHDRALVSPLPGTTRDFLEEQCDLDGLPVRLVDTAGLRGDGTSPDCIEARGMELARRKLDEADALVLVVDGAAIGDEGLDAEICPDPVAADLLAQNAGTPMLVVLSKRDLHTPAHLAPRWAEGHAVISVSALAGDHVDELAHGLRSLLLAGNNAHAPADGLAPNARQALALEAALDELGLLADDIRNGQSYDCCAVRLESAVASLGEVTGLGSAADVLNRVFSQFCIGK